MTDKVIHAAQYGDLSYLETCIECSNLSVDTVDEENCSLMHWAAINKRYEIVEYLTDKRANINIVGGINGEIPLQWAVRHPKNSKMVSLFVQKGADFHHKSVYGFDALFIAVQEGRTNLVFILLNSGADPNTCNESGDTPLYWLLKTESAIDRNNLIRLLLRFNASVIHMNKGQYNAFHLMLNTSNHSSGADPNSIDLDNALLIYTAAFSRKEIDTLLSAKNGDGRTPRELAVYKKSSVFVRFLFDAYIYSTFPSWTAIVTTGIAFCLIFVAVHFLGWWMGSGLLVPLYFAWQGTSQPSIVRAQSRLSCGGAWGVIVTIVTGYSLFLSHLYSWPWNLLVGSLACVICGSLFHTMNTPPQSISHLGKDSLARVQLIQRIVQSEEDVADTDEEGDPEFRLCTTCLVDKSHASMHCSKCDICVVNLDHHCPYVCNCVGPGNRRAFILFTYSASLGCALVAVMSFWVQYHVLCEHTAESASTMLWRFVAVQQCMVASHNTLNSITWLSAVASVWIFFIFCGQVGLVAGETTTFQVIRHHNYGVDMWNARGLRNVMSFLKTGSYAVTLKSNSRAQQKSGIPHSHDSSRCNSKHCKHDVVQTDKSNLV